MIVGVTGKAGSGKDTVAGQLVGKYGYRRAQFAFDLKRMVCETFGWDRDAMDSDVAALKLDFDTALAYKEDVPLNPDGTFQCPGPDGEGMSRRQVLIHWGTNCMRYIDPDIHVKLTMARLAPGKILPGGRPGFSKYVFSDVRFLNETQAIRELGGEIWRVVKIGGPGTDEASGSNQSEVEMDRIVPDRTFEAAHGQIPLLLSRVDQVFGS